MSANWKDPQYPHVALIIWYHRAWLWELNTLEYLIIENYAH